MSRLNKYIPKYSKPTPREQAKKISDGKEKPHFIGKKGNAVYQQEFFSLLNQNNRDHNFKQKFKVLCEELEKNNPELLASLRVKYQKFQNKIKWSK